MNNNKENFVIEKYDSEFDYKPKKNDLNVSFNRVAFIFFVFLIIFFVFSFKILYLSNLTFTKKNTFNSISEQRSNILDRDGNILAKSITTTKEQELITDSKIPDKRNKFKVNQKIITEFFKIQKTFFGINFGK